MTKPDPEMVKASLEALEAKMIHIITIYGTNEILGVFSSQDIARQCIKENFVNVSECEHNLFYARIPWRTESHVLIRVCAWKVNDKVISL